MHNCYLAPLRLYHYYTGTLTNTLKEIIKETEGQS